MQHPQRPKRARRRPPGTAALAAAVGISGNAAAQEAGFHPGLALSFGSLSTTFLAPFLTGTGPASAGRRERPQFP